MPAVCRVRVSLALSLGLELGAEERLLHFANSFSNVRGGADSCVELFLLNDQHGILGGLRLD